MSITTFFTRRFQRRCEHPPNLVTADILDGEAILGGFVASHPVEVQWCRKCGAYRCVYNRQSQKLWRVPNAKDGKQTY